MILPLSRQQRLGDLSSADSALLILVVAAVLLSVITLRANHADHDHRGSMQSGAVSAFGPIDEAILPQPASGSAPVSYTPACIIGASPSLAISPSVWSRLLSTPWETMILALVFVAALAAWLLAARRKLKPENQHHSASRDQLTGLPNRSALISQIEEAIKAAKLGRRSALLLIDVDDFRTLNNTLSYGAGDEVLVQVAQHIADQVRDEDFVARFGDDAFAVLARTPTLDQAMVTAERIRESLESMRVQMGVAPIRIYLTASIGVCGIDGESSAKDVALRADSALCQAKESGKNRVVSLSGSADGTEGEPDAYARIAMIEDALENDKFILHFQPILPIGSINRHKSDSRLRQTASSEYDNALKWVGGEGTARLYEALVRIESADGRVIPPGEFIPWAEAIGLIPQVDLWVLRKVIAILNERPDMNIAMNLSARSISRSSFLAQVERCVSRSGLAPGRLGFEITETAGLGNLKAVRNWMKRMKTLGCCFAIDDFGSGHTSMAYLSNLPVDIVKVAGTIVRGMPGNPAHGLIVEAISSMVHVAGAWTVAESVENGEILSALMDMRVDFAQGFYFARPSDLETIAARTPRNPVA
jgi:diguanylate cyclase (GGDEF)-like protein